MVHSIENYNKEGQPSSNQGGYYSNFGKFETTAINANL